MKGKLVAITRPENEKPAMLIEYEKGEKIVQDWRLVTPRVWNFLKNKKGAEVEFDESQRVIERVNITKQPESDATFKLSDSGSGQKEIHEDIPIKVRKESLSLAIETAKMGGFISADEISKRYDEIVELAKRYEKFILEGK